MISPEAGRVFTAAMDAMSEVLPGLMEWADTMLEGSEREEALFHVGRLTDEFRTLMDAVSDYAGVEP